MNLGSTLVAKHSPQNGCFGSDSELLCLLPPVKEPDREGGYVFTGTTTKSKNQYGWVKKSDAPFTLEEFIERAGLPKDNQVTELQSLLLMAIGRLDEGTPVAVDYMLRGLPPRLELVVHKVIFQKPVKS